MAENENGTANNPYTGKTVKIRTNIGWVQVVTSSDGWVTKEQLETAKALLRQELLSKSDYINKELADKIFQDSVDISKDFK